MEGETMENFQEEPEEPEEEDQQIEISEAGAFVEALSVSEGVHEAPIDINIAQTRPLDAPPIEWHNFEIPPKKMKVTNTGHTGRSGFQFEAHHWGIDIELVILSAKWGQERPYITKGPLSGKYVFSQLHFHWGINDMEGSEHTVDGAKCPGEMHVVLFKSCYLTQEAALKERDGIVVLCYIFRLQEGPNAAFSMISDATESITKAHDSLKIPPVNISTLIKPFDSDYFLYWGAVSTSSCRHYIMWLITRVPMGVAAEQIDNLRFLYDGDDEPLRRNFRPTQERLGRTILHVAPSTSKYATLHPLAREEADG